MYHGFFVFSFITDLYYALIQFSYSFYSALHRAGRDGDVQACRVLLQYGVDPTIISLQGYTATQLATEPVQRLLHGKALWLWFLFSSEKILKYLKLATVAKVHLTCPDFENWFVIRYYAMAMVKLNSRHKLWKYVYLNLASSQINSPPLKALQPLKRDSRPAEDPPGPGVDSEQQLLEASKSGDIECVRRILTAQPYLVNVRDLDGRHSTPLHFAAGYNRVPIVEYLLQHGADVHAKDKGWVEHTCQGGCLCSCEWVCLFD